MGTTLQQPAAIDQAQHDAMSKSTMRRALQEYAAIVHGVQRRLALN
jgi:hypothetical protein